MILRYVHYEDFNKDYMILPGVRYNYFVEDRMAILDHLIIRWDHTQRYKQGYNRCNYAFFKIFVFVFYLSPMICNNVLRERFIYLRGQCQYLLD
jgi:hypothetical protein